MKLLSFDEINLYNLRMVNTANGFMGSHALRNDQKLCIFLSLKKYSKAIMKTAKKLLFIVFTSFTIELHS